MTYLVDLDGVLRNLTQYICLNNKVTLSDGTVITDPDEWTEWNGLINGVPANEYFKGDCYDAFINAAPYPNAKAFIDIVRGKGVEVIFCTAQSGLKNRLATLHWLYDKGFMEQDSQIIFVKNAKDKLKYVNADTILIDDSPDLAGKDYVYSIERPWNPQGDLALELIVILLEVVGEGKSV